MLHINAKCVGKSESLLVKSCPRLIIYCKLKFSPFISLCEPCKKTEKFRPDQCSPVHANWLLCWEEVGPHGARKGKRRGKYLRKRENVWGKEENVWGKEENVWGKEENVWGKEENVWGKEENVWGKEENAWGKKENVWGKQENVWGKVENV